MTSWRTCSEVKSGRKQLRFQLKMLDSAVWKLSSRRRSSVQLLSRLTSQRGKSSLKMKRLKWTREHKLLPNSHWLLEGGTKTSHNYQTCFQKLLLAKRRSLKRLRHLRALRSLNLRKVHTAFTQNLSMAKSSNSSLLMSFQTLIKFKRSLRCNYTRLMKNVAAQQLLW